VQFLLYAVAGVASSNVSSPSITFAKCKNKIQRGLATLCLYYK
jgi:hypothetical protein